MYDMSLSILPPNMSPNLVNHASCLWAI
jgi:hypothetical protein